jgi:hypothetical protein
VFVTAAAYRASNLAAHRRCCLAKVFTIPVLPDPNRRKTKQRKTDPRYIEGQKVLVEAIRYLAKQDPEGNKEAVTLLSEHFRTRFRMSDRPADLPAVTPEQNPSS